MLEDMSVSSDSSTTFRLPAGGRGDVIIRTGTSPVGNQLLIPYGDPDCTVTLWLELGGGSKLVC